MSEPAIRCEKCGKKFCRSEGDMGAFCSQCECERREEPVKEVLNKIFGEAVAEALFKGEHLLQGIVGKQIAGWRIVFAEMRGRNFKVIFQHDTSKEVKEVMEADVVWKEKGIPLLLAKAHARPVSDLGHLCKKHGEFYFGDFCVECNGETFVPDPVRGDAASEEAMGNSQWKCQTVMHILRVQELLQPVIVDLVRRMDKHDATKMEEPERATFAKFTRKLKGSTYGSDEYKGFLKEMKPALDHHYAVGRHHPEHFVEDGVTGMNLVDLLEMLADWKAASERHADGDIKKSLEINEKRFNIRESLMQVLWNTVRDLGWYEGK